MELRHDWTIDQAEAILAPDFWNHDLDTSPHFYETIITTRTYQDRMNTLANVRANGVSLCCGGIVGMGESAAESPDPVGHDEPVGTPTR